MKKSDCYKNIADVEYIGTCSDKNVARIARKIRYVASKRKIHQLFRKLKEMNVGIFTLDEMEKFYNPYRYFIDEKYIDVVHSGIDHVFKIIRI